MNVDKRILERIDGLLATATQLLTTRRDPGPNMIGFDSWVDGEQCRHWGVNCLNLLSRVFGQESEHYRAFKADFDKGNGLSDVKRAIGTLKAAKDDYEHDQLFETRRLIEAELFDDFLEMAQHLHEQGYHGPAAVVAGAVLEDGLRKLCTRHSIALPTKPKLDTMNADLARSGAYTLLVQKHVTALADLRNNAAHGNWRAFSKDDVEHMIKDIRRFMEKHFT
jgi:hypothetical protein